MKKNHLQIKDLPIFQRFKPTFLPELMVNGDCMVIYRGKVETLKLWFLPGADLGFQYG